MAKSTPVLSWKRRRWAWLGVAVPVLAAIIFSVWMLVRHAPSSDGDDDDADLALPLIPFREITQSAGIAFHHTNGAFGKKLLPETMGSGVAILDYDGDGHPDILFINSCSWPGQPSKDQRPPTLKLYRNRGDLAFEDVTEAVGLDVTLYGMGVTVGDYDNDGWPDIFITAVGGNRLFRNEPKDPADPSKGRRFIDVTDKAGVGGPGGWPSGVKDFPDWNKPITFSTSATFLDYDGDGLLDLFVCNYITWSPAFDLSQDFRLAGIGRAYGPPTTFEGAHCFLYRNRGNGTFEDVSAHAGIQVIDPTTKKKIGKALGVVAFDLDDDGWPDLFIANDTAPNFCFHNVPVDPADPSKGRKFVEVAQQLGVATTGGYPRGGMGIDWGEYRPGKPAVLIGNFEDEPDTLLVRNNPNQLRLEDMAFAEGLFTVSRPLLKFGVFFLDFDLDGRLDIFTCNGHLEPDLPKVRASLYAQPIQLFWNNGKSRRCFQPMGAKNAGQDLLEPLVGRGAAFADFDGDGRPDIVVTTNGGRARLFHNEGQTGNHWVRIRLEGDGKTSNRSAIGAVATLYSGESVLKRVVTAGRGYLSQSELTLTFGLGPRTTIDRVEVSWPGRQRRIETFRGLAIDREHRLRQGHSTD